VRVLEVIWAHTRGRLPEHVIGYALSAAAFHHRFENVKFLAPKVSNRRYLDRALNQAILGNPEMIAFLLQRGARPKGGTLAQAAQYRAGTTLEMLLKTGVDPDLEVTYKNLDRHGRTALMAAIACCSDSWWIAVPLLIRYGASVNAVDAQGNTPLSLATTARRKELIELLRAAGAQ
jgi:ankyrin repeat protein